MEYLGLVPELSNGEVDIVNASQLSNNFQNILTKKIIATECNLIFKVHQGMIIQDDLDTIGSDSLQRSIGNVTNDLVITFEYSIKSFDELKKLNIEDLKVLPFQVQIYYRDVSGAKKVRCISKQQQITTNKQTAEDNLDIQVVSANAVQQSAKLASKGQYAESRERMVANQKMMKRNLKAPSQASGYCNFVNVAADLDNALLEQEQEELKLNTKQDYSSRKNARKDKVANKIYQAKKWK